MALAMAMRSSTKKRARLLAAPFFVLPNRHGARLRVSPELDLDRFDLLDVPGLWGLHGVPAFACRRG